VIVANFNAFGIASVPYKADAPLVIDADAVLPDPVPDQRFEPVIGRNAKVIKALCSIHHSQLAPRNGLNLIRQFFGEIANPDSLSWLVLGVRPAGKYPWGTGCRAAAFFRLLP
jgi:hypothetical protein